MSTDGGLRSLYRKYLPAFQWTTIESPFTEAGIPDCEFCAPNGVSGWIENKLASGFVVHLRPEQIAWLHRRHRHRGRAFIAVRKRNKSIDDFFLFASRDVVTLTERGLRTPPLLLSSGGPSRWSWEQVASILSEPLSAPPGSPEPLSRSASR